MMTFTILELHSIHYSRKIISQKGKF